MYGYTCIKCGKHKHITGATRTMISQGLKLICATCHRRIREEHAEIRRGLN